LIGPQQRLGQLVFNANLEPRLVEELGRLFMRLKKLQTTRDVMHHVLPYVHGRVADIGAGSAKYKEILLTRGTAYIAFDMTPGPDIDAVGDIEQLPFDDYSFDTVICTQVLEHIPDPQRAVGEFYRILRKDGICVITVPFFAPYHRNPEDFYRYTPEALAYIATKAGLDVIEQDIYTLFFTAVVQIIQFRFFNPLQERKATAARWSDRFLRALLRIGRFLDSHFSTTTMFGNSYVIARKH
jgi:SAM-dependent methyltransferase